MAMIPAKDSLDLGILVSDIEASLRFYRDFLGLAYEGVMDVGYGQLYRLRFGTCEVKLIIPKKIPTAGAIGLGDQLGFRYITFFVQNLSQVCSELKENGVEFTIKERELLPGVRIARVKDPDGNLVEFVQRS